MIYYNSKSAHIELCKCTKLENQQGLASWNARRQTPDSRRLTNLLVVWDPRPQTPDSLAEIIITKHRVSISLALDIRGSRATISPLSVHSPRLSLSLSFFFFVVVVVILTPRTRRSRGEGRTGRPTGRPLCFVFIDGSDDGPLGRPTTIDYFKGTNTLPRVHGSSLYKGSLVGLLSVAVYLCTTLRWNRHPDLDPDLDHVRRGYARVKRDLPRRLPGQQRLPALLGGRSESAAGGRWRGDFRYFLFDLWGRGGRYARGRRGAGGGSGAGAVAIRRRGSTFSFRRGAAPGGRGGFWDRSPWGRAGRTNDGRRRAPPPVAGIENCRRAPAGVGASQSPRYL